MTNGKSQIIYVYHSSFLRIPKRSTEHVKTLLKYRFSIITYNLCAVFKNKNK